MNRSEQNRQFKRNAHIRQKIYGGLFSIAVLIFWAWLMAYDCTCVWWAVLAVPAVIVGAWLMVTKNNYVWDITTQERRRNWIE